MLIIPRFCSKQCAHCYHLQCAWVKYPIALDDSSCSNLHAAWQVNDPCSSVKERAWYTVLLVRCSSLIGVIANLDFNRAMWRTVRAPPCSFKDTANVLKGSLGHAGFSVDAHGILYGHVFGELEDDEVARSLGLFTDTVEAVFAGRDILGEHQISAETKWGPG